MQQIISKSVFKQIIILYKQILSTHTVTNRRKHQQFKSIVDDQRQPAAIQDENRN
jgi:hypothetical protein